MRGNWTYKRSKGYRSNIEEDNARWLDTLGIPYKYEKGLIDYTIPESTHRYIPDFILENGIIVEIKGLFSKEDRDKHLRVKEMYPWLDIRFVFANPSLRIYKGAKTTYKDWCEKNGFKYATKKIPFKWFEEPVKPLKGVYFKNE